MFRLNLRRNKENQKRVIDNGMTRMKEWKEGRVRLG